MNRLVSAKIRSLLEDRDVKRWYENLARGSPITAEVNLRRVSLFCRQHEFTPRDLAVMGEKSRRGLEDLIQDHVGKMEREGKAPGYIEGVLKGVKSWLTHNEVELKRKVRIGDRNATPTIADERVPEREELQTMLMYAEQRAKACISLVAYSGLRLQTIGNEDGTDGLTVGDLPELRVVKEHVEFTEIPTLIRVRSTLSKARNKYFTFLPAEGCQHLAAYLDSRLASGETFTSTPPVISVNPGWRLRGHRKNSGNGDLFVCTRSVSNIIREAVRPRFQWRPYVLRAYFDTQLLIAESHGKVTHPYRQFWMGHKGDIEARYTTNKGRLPDNLVEDMRRSFKDSAGYLETTPKAEERSPEEKFLETTRHMAKVYGIDPEKVKVEVQQNLGREPTAEEEGTALKEEIQKVNIPVPLVEEVKSVLKSNPKLKLNPEQFVQEAIKEKVAKQGQKKEGCSGGGCEAEPENGNGHSHKVVGEGELVSHLDEGWEMVKELSDGRMVLRR